MMAQASRIWKAHWLPLLLWTSIIVLILCIAGEIYFSNRSGSFGVFSIGYADSPQALDIVTARGETTTWNIHIDDGAPGYWASTTGLVLKLNGLPGPLTVLQPQDNTWDQNGFVSFSSFERAHGLTINTTFTIPSSIAGPEERSLSGTLTGIIIYPVISFNSNPLPPTTIFGGFRPYSPYVYDNKSTAISLPVHLQLVSRQAIPWISGQLPLSILGGGAFLSSMTLLTLVIVLLVKRAISRARLDREFRLSGRPPIEPGPPIQWD